jgi:hypothetical protein
MPMDTGGIPGASQQKPDTDTTQQKGTPKKKTKKPVGVVADILDRRNESRRYMQINYWDQWEDVFRASKCRTKPIMVTDKTGNQTEDKTRTNVAMPELSLIIRRKTARLTASPPQINYTCPEGGDTDLADRLTAWSYYQFDRSGEAQEHRRTVMGAQTFGHCTSKLYWDTVEVEKKFFQAFVKSGEPYAVNRSGLMRMQGAPDDEISGAIKEQGEELGDNEISQAIAKYGNTAQVPTKIKQFEGPVSKSIFIGDLFMEPGAARLNESGWVVENYWESDVWLKKMGAKTYLDEDGTTELPIFDPKAIEELSNMPSWQPIYQQQPFDLRSRLRTNALGQTLPLWPTKLLKGKRYDILECHTKDKDGQFWIEWVGNEKVYLGKMPYPWDLYGKYCYTELVPMFDLLSAYGDASPLLLRHLWLLHNAIVGSRRDLVANLLRPLMKAKTGTDIPDEQVDRALMRVIFMRDPDSLQPMMEPLSAGPAIQAATEEEAQNMRMMALAEPNLTNVETGTDTNPQAGKTATTAVLAAKSADALTQFEIDSLNWYLKETGEKKLAMLQQTEPEQDGDGQYKQIQVGEKYTGMVEGLTQRYGKASSVNIQFMELQQEIQVEPAALSMLSVDDDIRRQAAQQLVAMASSMPNIVDPYYAAKFYASTIRGIDPDKAVPPPKPPGPPPPRVGLNVTAKLPELTPQERLQIMGAGVGVQATPDEIQNLQIDHTLKGIEKLSTAADHADNLMSNKSVDDEPETPMSKGVGNASPSSKV